MQERRQHAQQPFQPFQPLQSLQGLRQRLNENVSHQKQTDRAPYNPGQAPRSERQAPGQAPRSERQAPGQAPRSERQAPYNPGQASPSSDNSACQKDLSQCQNILNNYQSKFETSISQQGSQQAFSNGQGSPAVQGQGRQGSRSQNQPRQSAQDQGNWQQNQPRQGQDPNNQYILAEYRDEQGDVNSSQIQRRTQYGGSRPSIPTVRYVFIRTNQPQNIQISQIAVYADDNATLNLAQGKPTNSLNVLPNAPTYQGAFVDWTNSARAMNYVNSGSLSYTFDTCRQSAVTSNNTYFGLQDVNTSSQLAQCFVSNDLTASMAQGASTNVTTGNDGYIYGNASVNSIYKIVPQAVASNAVDGTLAPRAYPNIYHSVGQTGDFWSVDLGAAYAVNKIVYYNRQDCCNERALNYVLELQDGNGKVVWSGGTFTSDMIQTFNFSPPITDPFRFMPIVKKCEGYVNQVSTGPDYERSFFKKQIADVCMPYYTTELNKCQIDEGHTVANIENKIAKCATSLHTCQTAFNINTQNSVKSAIYGNKDSKQTMDVLALLNKQRSEGTAEIVVSNVTFGTDPAPGVPKFLYLTLHTSYNTDQKYTIPENQTINLDAPDATAPPPSGISPLGLGTLIFSTLGQGQSGGAQRGGWMAFNEPTFLTNIVAKIEKIEHNVLPSTISPDKSPHCKVWAAKRPSTCKTDPIFMNNHCATSCAVAPAGAPLPADLQRAANMKYGIEYHREYPAFLKRYKPKKECPDKRYVLKADVAPVFEQTLRLVKKLNDLKANFSTDIRSHPDYKILMDKYALRDSQNNYTPCSKC